MIILSQNEILVLNEVGDCWPWGEWGSIRGRLHTNGKFLLLRHYGIDTDIKGNISGKELDTTNRPWYM